LIAELFVRAAYWRPDDVAPPPGEVLAEPELARYVEGFGRSGDFDLVAEGPGGEPRGAAWWRHFPAAGPGYGFMDEATPEIAIAVMPADRGQGVGTGLMRALLDEAARSEIEAVSLSVAKDNPARRLYERLGFRTVESSAEYTTMAIRIADR
jgi:ribosomal protein S18 acetylase RimI-like enzyme